MSLCMCTYLFFLCIPWGWIRMCKVSFGSTSENRWKLSGIQKTKTRSLPQPSYKTFFQRPSVDSASYDIPRAALCWWGQTRSVGNLVGLISSSQASHHGYNGVQTEHIPAVAVLVLTRGHPDNNDINDPQYDKTNKMTCAPSKDSDQPGLGSALNR